MTDLWDQVFLDELGIDPTQHPVTSFFLFYVYFAKMLLTDLPNMSEVAKKKMMHIFFEQLCVPAVCVANPAVLSLYSLGLTTGLVVDCGNRLQIVPVVDGCVIEAATYKLKRGIAGLTEHLSRLMTKRGYFMTTASQMEVVRKIKESLCFVSQDVEADMAKPESELEKTYTLPDGKSFTLGRERFQCPESLFIPNELGVDAPGLHEILAACVAKCPIDSRKALLSHIILVGGSTLFPGLTSCCI